MTTEKTIALTIWTFVGKVMSLFFNMLRFVIAFLPWSYCLLILWMQSLSTVILEHKEIKSVTVSIVFPSICHEGMGPDAMIFVFFHWPSFLKALGTRIIWTPQHGAGVFLWPCSFPHPTLLHCCIFVKGLFLSWKLLTPGVVCSCLCVPTPWGQSP